MEELLSMFCCGYVLIIGVLVALVVVWVVSLIDVVRRDDSQFPQALRGNRGHDERLTWVLVVLLAGPLGAVIYQVVVVRPAKRSRSW